MGASIQLASLSTTFKCWKYLGIWPDVNHKSIYKYYSYVLIFLTLILYNVLLTINLIYTPMKFELVIEEITFFFSVVAIAIKMLIMLFWKKTLKEILKTLAGKEFEGTDDATNEILIKDIKYYKIYWRGVVGLGNFVFVIKLIVPVLTSWIVSAYQIPLPTSNYNFLSEKTKNDYFILIFTYQCFGIYAMMMYDVTSEAFINGIIYFVITQMKVLNFKFRSLGAEKYLMLSRVSQERIHITKLKECLRHYDCILKYCNDVQKMITIIMFVKYGIGSTVICILMCGLILPMPIDALAFMVFYILGIVLQFYVPCWLGTELTHQSEELVFAAFSSDWISRTEPFKRSIKVFMERARTPIVLVGLKLFPLSLKTFTTIMKTAYSFFTLLKNFQHRENTDT